MTSHSALFKKGEGGGKENVHFIDVSFGNSFFLQERVKG